MPTLVIGYNVEWTSDPSITKKFLTQVRKRHEGLDAPCTLYLRAEIVDKHHRLLEPLVDDPRFDMQATIEGPLKTVCQVAEGETSVWPGAGAADIEKDLVAAIRAVEELTGTAPIGLSDSLGAYRGLQDRPDLLRVLDDNGIRFTRIHARDHHDWQPVEFSVEPYWYTFQGFPHILEFPAQGWQEAIIRKLYEWEETDGYIDFIKTDVEEVAARDDLIWSHWVQDWSAIREDDELTIVREMITHARNNGIDIRSQMQAYELLREGNASE